MSPWNAVHANLWLCFDPFPLFSLFIHPPISWWHVRKTGFFLLCLKIQTSVLGTERFFKELCKIPTESEPKVVPILLKSFRIIFFFLTLLMTSGVNCIRTIQETLRKCYLGPYFKTLTDILSLISIHIMSQTICSRIGEVNWLNSSSVYLIIYMGAAWKTSSPTTKKGRNIAGVIFVCRSMNYLYWSFWLRYRFYSAEMKMNGLL